MTMAMVSDIPKPLEDTSFRMPELIIIKASPLINGYSLKKGENEEPGYLRHPSRVGFKTIYAALLISKKTLQACSFLENAGAHSPERPSLQSKPYLDTFFIPAESSIFMLLGYKYKLRMES